MLMIMSIVLLVVFEGFWLRTEYNEQRDALATEQSQFFYAGIRSLEDSLFNEMVLRPLQISVDSFEFSNSEGRKLVFQREMDTSRYVTVVRSISMEDRRRDYRERMKNGQREHRSTLLGALSLQLAQSDTLLANSQMMTLISDQLKKDRKYNIPLDYELINWREGDTVNIMGLQSAPYMDYWSRQNYAIVYPEYSGYLLSNMWRQIMFAVVLLLCVTGAFSLVYRSLVKERKLLRLRNDFVNNITHELKTPMSTVKVALEAINNFSDDPVREKEYIGIAQSELERLSLLVDKVLQMSQLDEGTTRLKVEPFDMRELIGQILDTMKVQFDRMAAKVNFTSKGEDFTIEGDRLHMTGVVYNLLDNAIKYRNGDPSIDVDLVQENGTITLTIEDNGKGIEGNYVDKIFDKFFRVPTGDRHNIKGHGLGLSYVAEVVEQHHGSIDVKSEIGKGSTFEIKFPRQHAS